MYLCDILLLNRNIRFLKLLYYKEGRFFFYDFVYKWGKCKLFFEIGEYLFCFNFFIDLKVEKIFLCEIVLVKSRGKKDGGSLGNFFF